MIANSIILSDKFLDLSKDAKLLWFYVVGGADDDGYCNSVKSLRKIIEVPELAISELINFGYLRMVIDGVYHIEGWEQFNKVQESRRVKSQYIDADEMSTRCQQDVNNLSQSIVEYKKQYSSSIVQEKTNNDTTFPLNHEDMMLHIMTTKKWGYPTAEKIIQKFVELNQKNINNGWDKGKWLNRLGGFIQKEHTEQDYIKWCSEQQKQTKQQDYYYNSDGDYDDGIEWV